MYVCKYIYKYINIYIYIYVQIYTYKYIYIYIYVQIYIYTYIYTYIYVYMYTNKYNTYVCMYVYIYMNTNKYICMYIYIIYIYIHMYMYIYISKYICACLFQNTPLQFALLKFMSTHPGIQVVEAYRHCMALAPQCPAFNSQQVEDDGFACDFADGGTPQNSKALWRLLASGWTKLQGLDPK